MDEGNRPKRISKTDAQDIEDLREAANRVTAVAHRRNSEALRAVVSCIWSYLAETWAGEVEAGKG